MRLPVQSLFSAVWCWLQTDRLPPAESGSPGFLSASASLPSPPHEGRPQWTGWGIPQSGCCSILPFLSLSAPPASRSSCFLPGKSRRSSLHRTARWKLRLWQFLSARPGGSRLALWRLPGRSAPLLYPLNPERIRPRLLLPWNSRWFSEASLMCDKSPHTSAGPQESFRHLQA